jgi:hypothetical protein
MEAVVAEFFIHLLFFLFTVPAAEAVASSTTVPALHCKTTTPQSRQPISSS